MGLHYDRFIEERFLRVARNRCIALAEEVVEEIRRSPDTPTDTGELRNSFRAEPTARGALVTSDVDYWRYVEFGTEEHGRAQRPVRKAMERVRAKHAASFRPRRGR